MAEIRQAVDDGHAAVLGQGLHLVLTEGADHDAVHIAGEHPGRVLNRFAPADLRAFCPQHHGVAPQLVDAHLKADAGAGGGLLKNHAQALAPEMGVLDAVLGLILQLVGQVQDVENFLAGEIQQLQQVFHGCSFLSVLPPVNGAGRLWVILPGLSGRWPGPGLYPLA